MNNSRKSLVSALISACFIGASIVPAQAAAAVQVPAGFTITGAGWGHGLGLSQYGAYGMALDGFKYDQILTHYYQGTTVASQPTPAALKVGIETGQSTIFVRGEDNPLNASAGGALSIVIDGGSLITIPAATDLTFTFVDSTFTMSGTGVTTATGSSAIISWDNSSSLVNLNAGVVAAAALGTAPCSTTSCPHRYKYGTFEIKAKNAINTLQLTNQYLYGLGEMPSSWPAEALKAQAVAARSFALMQSRAGLNASCLCNIGVTDSAQVFVGFSKEYAASGSAWVAAVDATAGAPDSGMVVMSGPAVITGYYSSSTGGMTQPRSQVWGTSPISWLSSVDDHWSQDPRVNNPNASWVASIDQATLVKRLNAAGVPIADVWSMTLVSNYVSGGVSRLDLSDSAGNLTSLTIAPGQPLTPDKLRGVLGIKSTYISKITAGIATIAGSTTVTAKTLTGITKVNWPKTALTPIPYTFTGKITPAQLGATVSLQRKVGASWVTITKATTTATGTWKMVWAAPPPGKNAIRIRATNSKGSVNTGTQSISVAGKIWIAVPKSLKRNAKAVITGSVSPGLAGVKVSVERQVGAGKWQRVRIVRTNSSGVWTFTNSVGSKRTTISYRAKTSDSRLGTISSTTKRVSIK